MCGMKGQAGPWQAQVGIWSSLLSAGFLLGLFLGYSLLSPPCDADGAQNYFAKNQYKAKPTNRQLEIPGELDIIFLLILGIFFPTASACPPLGFVCVNI